MNQQLNQSPEDAIRKAIILELRCQGIWIDILGNTIKYASGKTDINIDGIAQAAYQTACEYMGKHILILDDGAAPEVGDIIKLEPYTTDNPHRGRKKLIAEIEDIIEGKLYLVGEGFTANKLDYIIQRNGLPVIYRSALKKEGK